MLAGEVGDLLAGEHAGDLFDAAVAVEGLEGDEGAAVGDALGGAEVVVGEARHLRQVGDGEDLAALREALELAAHGGGFAAADAGVDLVEDHGSAARASGAAHREL